MNRNKTKLNATIILLALILLIFIGSINVCAEDEYMNQVEKNTEETTTYTSETKADNITSEDKEVPNHNNLGGKSDKENTVSTPENVETSTSDGENITLDSANQDNSGDFDRNVFEEIYRELEHNADKIFSVLAFIGTLIVGLGYKSGLLPILRENLSRLKGTIDLVKADGEESKAKVEEKFTELTSAIQDITNEIKDMKGGYECYKEMNRQRESLRLILEGQIDMLYAIFMTSALPQYQKDEVGEKINRMKEELKTYESDEEN